MRMMFLRGVALIAILVAGCCTHPPAADNLVLKELFGVKLSEPWGGKLKESKFFGVDAGAFYVSKWMEMEWMDADLPKELKVRGYSYHGEGPFDSKSSWEVSEIVDWTSGEVFEVYADLSLLASHSKSGYEEDCTRYNGGRLVAHLTGLLGAATRERRIDGQFDPIDPHAHPAKGRFADVLEWELGSQLVTVYLWNDDPSDPDGRNGSIFVDVSRMDIFEAMTRDGGFRFSLHKFATQNEAGDVSVRWQIRWPESLSGLNERGLSSVRREILQMTFGPAWRFLKDDDKAWMPPPTIAEAAEEIKRALNNPNGLNMTADVELEWPFGKSAREGADWYEKPVLVAKNNGSACFVTTCGCTDYAIARTFSLPDGRELMVDDYFDGDKIAALSALVRQRLSENVDVEVPDINLRDRDVVSMRVKESGVCFYFAPYTILSGAYGTTKVFLKWSELSEFRQVTSD